MAAYWDRLDNVKDIIKSDFGSPRAPSYSLVLHGTLRRTYVQITLLAPTSKLVGIYRRRPVDQNQTTLRKPKLTYFSQNRKPPGAEGRFFNDVS